MGKAASIVAITLVLLLGGGGLLLAPLSAHRTPAAVHYLEYQYSTFSENSDFFTEAILAAGERSIPTPRNHHKPRVGVVSHHLLAKDLIADFFRRLSVECQPTTIVLIGPNHRSRGRDPIASSALSWKTPLGFVHPDHCLLEEMLQMQAVNLNEDAFYNEHSIGSLVPFVRAFFPKTRIVPLIVRPDADTTRVLEVADWLADNLRDNTLVIGSLDFSHYKTSAAAQLEDEQTLEIMRTFRYDQWSNSHVDSRKTLLLLLRLVAQRNWRELDIVHHTNSGILIDSLNEPCTSYINCLFRSDD